MSIFQFKLIQYLSKLSIQEIKQNIFLTNQNSSSHDEIFDYISLICEDFIFNAKGFHSYFRIFVNSGESFFSGVEYSKVGWVLGESIDLCMICSSIIESNQRKINCHACGNIVCQNCLFCGEIRIHGLEELNYVDACVQCCWGQNVLEPVFSFPVKFPVYFKKGFFSQELQRSRIFPKFFIECYCLKLPNARVIINILGSNLIPSENPSGLTLSSQKNNVEAPRMAQINSSTNSFYTHKIGSILKSLKIFCYDKEIIDDHISLFSVVINDNICKELLDPHCSSFFKNQVFKQIAALLTRSFDNLKLDLDSFHLNKKYLFMNPKFSEIKNKTIYKHKPDYNFGLSFDSMVPSRSFFEIVNQICLKSLFIMDQNHSNQIDSHTQTQTNISKESIKLKNYATNINYSNLYGVTEFKGQESDRDSVDSIEFSSRLSSVQRMNVNLIEIDEMESFDHSNERSPSVSINRLSISDLNLFGMKSSQDSIKVRTENGTISIDEKFFSISDEEIEESYPNEKESTIILNEAVINPKVLIGWKILIHDNIDLECTGIWLILDTRKSFKRKTYFRLLSTNLKVLWRPLERSGRKKGLRFKLIRKLF